MKNLVDKRTQDELREQRKAEREKRKALLGNEVGKASDHLKKAKSEEDLKSEVDEEDADEAGMDEDMNATTDGELALHPNFTPSPSKLSSGRQSPQGKRSRRTVQSPSPLVRKGRNAEWSDDYWDGWKEARDTLAAPPSWGYDNSDGYGPVQNADHYAPYGQGQDRPHGKGKGKKDRGGKDKENVLPESEGHLRQIRKFSRHVPGGAEQSV